ncbi:MAG: phosphoribosyltransferase family protein, partial [Acidimicrobiia bacterium]
VQTGRDRRARAEDGPTFAAHPAAGGARLLVVDDVATTGTTLASAAAALRGAGAVTVAAATAARTPHPALHTGKELTGDAQGAAPESRF